MFPDLLHFHVGTGGTYLHLGLKLERRYIHSSLPISSLKCIYGRHFDGMDMFYLFEW